MSSKKSSKLMISVCSLFRHSRPLWKYCLITGRWKSRIVRPPVVLSQLRSVPLSESLSLRLARLEPDVDPPRGVLYVLS